MMRRMWTLLRSTAWAALGAGAVALVVGSCTAANPDYDPFSEGGMPPIGDMRPPPHADLRMPPPPKPDMAPPPQCHDRACESSTVSGVCVNGKLLADRTCPTSSTCKAGYCQVPPLAPPSTQGTACTSEVQCNFLPNTSDTSCEPFIVGGAAVWVCASRVGDGGSGASCTNGAECRSGYCIDSAGTCFRACSGSDTDCPVRNGTRLKCRAATIRVEGVLVTANSCVLP
jgi:hypothetical protein